MADFSKRVGKGPSPKKKAARSRAIKKAGEGLPGGYGGDGPAPKQTQAEKKAFNAAAKKSERAYQQKVLDSTGLYKVPKKLLTKSKLTMGVREGQKLTAEEKAAYKAGVAELGKKNKAMLYGKKKKPAKGKPSSDYDKGAAYVDSQYGGLGQAIDIIQGKLKKL